MKMKLLGVEATFLKLEAELNRITMDDARAIVKTMTEELRSKTPIDTGAARAAWHVTEQGRVFVVQNDAEYIAYLNNGSSKQAPAYFVETVALKYGTPVGAIVETKVK